MSAITTDELRSKIKELLDNDDDRLSAWECDFLDSVLGQLRNKGTLTQKQTETVEKLHKRLFG